MINPFDLIKKAGDMKNILQNLDLEGLQETGESGGGLVKVVVNGKLEMISLEIDPIAVDKRDIPMLQDLIIAACNMASHKMIEQLKNKIGSELGFSGLAGLNI